MHDPDSVAQSLLDLVLTDPRRARDLFVQHFEGHAESSDGLLDELARPAYARVRSMVANVARNHPQRARFVPALRRWYDSETDEFARRAIYAALKDAGEQTFTTPRTSTALLPLQVVELYRYISDRLKHRLRNSVLSAHSDLVELKQIVVDPVGESRTALARLEDALLMIERAVEATDADPEYFTMRPIDISDWLKRMNNRYAVQYPAIRLTIAEAKGPSPFLFASDYLLETIFWNLWLNAHQATGGRCEINTLVRRHAGSVEVLIVDNGPGFPDELQGVAFSQQYSTSGSTQRGRGLLEVAEAAERLGGSANLFADQKRTLRVRLLFPELRRP